MLFQCIVLYRGLGCKVCLDVVCGSRSIVKIRYSIRVGHTAAKIVIANQTNPVFFWEKPHSVSMSTSAFFSDRQRTSKIVAEEVALWGSTSNRYHVQRTHTEVQGLHAGSRTRANFGPLASWKLAYVESKAFTLQACDGQAPLSVRAAFELCKEDFKSDAFFANPEAMKNDGDLMEVLSL